MFGFSRIIMCTIINYRSKRKSKTLSLPKAIRITYGLVMIFITCQSMVWLVGA